jgi:predicted O-linked N-acetylglucosamine transferase (SPINDLY family)
MKMILKTINPQAVLQNAVGLHQAGRFAQAQQLYQQVLNYDKNNIDALHLLGLTLHQQGDHKQAIKLISKALKKNPKSPEMQNNLGEAYRAMGKITQAQGCYRKALSLRASYPEALNNLGLAYVAKGLAAEAIKNFRVAIKINSNYIPARVNLANALKKQGKHIEAIACCTELLTLQPDLIAAYNIMGMIYYETSQLTQAVDIYKQALQIAPFEAQINNNLGVVLRDLGAVEGAIACYRRAIKSNEKYSEAYNNLAVALKDTGEYQQASAYFEQALAINPDYPEAYFNLAGTLAKVGESQQAIAAYRNALSLKSDYQEARCELVHELRNNCDWSQLGELNHQLIKAVDSSMGKVYPFTFLCLSTSAQQQLQCAKNWSAMQQQNVEVLRSTLKFKFAKTAKHVLRIGYLSADFHQHATAYLITELFELHDRTKVEVFGYCCGQVKEGAARQRIKDACDQFVDISDLSHALAAQQIYADGIDILIDLKGYTSGARTEILALRPAPIQVSYLGYPGTMGANFIDYLITDKTIVPVDQAQYYSEQLVYMPDCYQVNDRKRKIASKIPTRSECELPDDALVFCCLNTTYKITPEIFDIWMRILLQVPNSVLWLIDPGELGKKNLLVEASDRGVTPQRILFAKKLPLDQHLARFKNADLFLDTFPVTAHTTASDALWAGIPVLTCLGDTFVSRVAASILDAANLNELIASSLADYESKAIELASNKRELLRLRDRTQALQQNSTLFDTPAFTQQLEVGYTAMWQNYIEHNEVKHIDLVAIT